MTAPPESSLLADPEHDPRTAELAANLRAMRDRIAAAAHAAGRDPATVTLIAVTKTFPAADAARLVTLGVADLGENRDQEAADKASEVAGLLSATGDPTPRWHFVGQLQRNKARSVVRYADVVHSVDSVRLARALGRVAAEERATALEVLIQVSIDGDPDRGGVSVEGLAEVAEAVADAPALRLGGVMAVAPMSWQPRAAFARLAEVSTRLQDDHPEARAVSAGMSHDLEEALACGATHLRVGSALLGKRASLR